MGVRKVVDRESITCGFLSMFPAELQTGVNIGALRVLGNEGGNIRIFDRPGIRICWREQWISR